MPSTISAPNAPSKNRVVLRTEDILDQLERVKDLHARMLALLPQGMRESGPNALDSLVRHCDAQQQHDSPARKRQCVCHLGSEDSIEDEETIIGLHGSGTETDPIVLH